MKRTKSAISVNKTISPTEEEEITRRFWAAPDDALFTRPETSVVTRKSQASLERDSWLGVGIPTIRLGGSVRYRKGDVIRRINASRSSTSDAGVSP